MSEIKSFKELMSEISYSWEYPLYDIQKYNDGSFGINKLHIKANEVSYKTQLYSIPIHVYEEFCKFYEFLESTKEYKVLIWDNLSRRFDYRPFDENTMRTVETIVLNYGN